MGIGTPLLLLLLLLLPPLSAAAALRGIRRVVAGAVIEELENVGDIL